MAPFLFTKETSRETGYKASKSETKSVVMFCPKDNEFQISRHFVTIFRNISDLQSVISLQLNDIFNFFFTFQFTSEYCFKVADLLCQKSKISFCCQSYDVIFPLKTIKIENTKAKNCWEYHFLFSCKVLAETDKNCKTSLKENTFCLQLNPA